MLQPGGYSRADIEKISKVSELYADPEIRARTIELVERQGYVHRHPVRFKRKDQTAYDALLSLTPIYVNGARYWQATTGRSPTSSPRWKRRPMRL